MTKPCQTQFGIKVQFFWCFSLGDSRLLHLFPCFLFCYWPYPFLGGVFVVLDFLQSPVISIRRAQSRTGGHFFSFTDSKVGPRTHPANTSLRPRRTISHFPGVLRKEDGVSVLAIAVPDRWQKRLPDRTLGRSSPTNHVASEDEGEPFLSRTDPALGLSTRRIHILKAGSRWEPAFFAPFRFSGQAMQIREGDRTMDGGGQVTGWGPASRPGPCPRNAWPALCGREPF